MKRIVAIAVAIVATLTAMAQNIAVVSPTNETSVFQTLDEAITNAVDGSIIYLPGGGFKVSDDSKINKKLTIMGVSHRGDTDNVDGATVISGNLFFVEGASGSAIIGFFLSGNVNIATGTDSVANFTAKFVNVKSFQVKNSKCESMFINQSYIRSTSNFGNCNVKITNCILHSLKQVDGGTIEHNVITSAGGDSEGWRTLYNVNSTSISYNFLLAQTQGWIHTGSNCYTDHNCIKEGEAWGDNPVVLPKGTKWEDVFMADKGVTIISNYHLNETWATSKDPDLTGLGIYGFSGNDFSDKALAPIPRIVSKKVADQTDGDGNLTIEITVKAK